jgi:SNF2 family DNA or RNA helicase
LLRKEHLRRFHEVMEAFRGADLEAVIYSDVLEYVDRENEIAEGLDLERQLLAKLSRGHDPLDGVLKTKLLPYQARGAIFAACRGRVVLADDMGLGKTVQALAAAEMLRRRRGIARVLVIAPASVKYQWKTEIEKFTGHPAQIIDGSLPRRRELYASPKFFNLTSYELALKDVRYMQELAPDLIILDEAQRIRNWTTATARTIKQPKSRYAFVLTRTPIENKLEELFSVVEFVDGRRLGPAFRFPAAIVTLDERDFIQLANRAVAELMAPRDGKLTGSPTAALLPELHHTPPLGRRSPIPGDDAMPGPPGKRRIVHCRRFGSQRIARDWSQGLSPTSQKRGPKRVPIRRPPNVRAERR